MTSITPRRPETGTTAVALLILLLSLPAAAQGATAAEVQQWLAAHNQYRVLHQAPPVSWSADIAASAQAYADTCPSGHSASAYGENIAWATNDRSAAAVVKMWYDEEPEYDYNSPGFTPGTGHFTQIVWKGTTQIGCGFATGCETSPMGFANTWVCQYNPPGNYIGQFAQNVLPPVNAASGKFQISTLFLLLHR